MSRIVILSGSPSSDSRTETVLRQIGRLLAYREIDIKHYSVRDIQPETLCHACFDSEEIGAIVDDLRQAAGVVIGSPVYKASYTGVLKALLDLLPEDILEGKPVIPVMVGGSGRHLLAIEFAFKPLLTELKGEPLQGVYVLDQQVDREAVPAIHDDGILQRMNEQLEQLIGKINKLYVAQAKS